MKDEDRARLAKYLSERIAPPNADGCILWLGSVDKYGYGVVNRGKKHLKAHRVAWMLKHGEAPDGMCVCHNCDVRACVNPDHLFIGTHVSNMADKVQKKRQSRGEDHARAKLNRGHVEEIRRLYAADEGMTYRQLGHRVGVSHETIRQIIAGIIWKA